MRWKRPDVADGLDLVEPGRRGALNGLVQNGVPHIGSNTGDDSINLPFLRAFLSGSLRRIARPLNGIEEVSEDAFRLLVPFACCINRNAAEAQRYRDGRLERVVERASVVALALSLSHDAVAVPAMMKECSFLSL